MPPPPHPPVHLTALKRAALRGTPARSDGEDARLCARQRWSSAPERMNAGSAAHEDRALRLVPEGGAPPRRHNQNPSHLRRSRSRGGFGLPRRAEPVGPGRGSGSSWGQYRSTERVFLAVNPQTERLKSR
ncbi:hypothetical protein OJAV_G00107170 [Oryzias javanicus]|uniref:Uncharacterized protein n=1 Tax=Oryzias javanicus TaxID=123683 RepID=A0A3S2PGU6_ORYJA|nr:hypothetical protein OJAV_G00107170 [Oryzias javanicus]